MKGRLSKRYMIPDDPKKGKKKELFNQSAAQLLANRQLVIMANRKQPIKLYRNAPSGEIPWFCFHLGMQDSSHET